VNAMTLARYTGRVPNRRARNAVPASSAYCTSGPVLGAGPPVLASPAEA
jgi:hypothetical protein